MTLTGPSIDLPLPAATDEAGTAPGDRRFRPDIQGLRAVAVVLVVLYHAGFKGLGGGYVGVDVFFVISGFVITGVLLRERSLGWSTSLRVFYGRRSRRIIPAATLVIVVTVVASYAVLGIVGGNQTAVDGRWTAVFLANFHFASLGTNYLTAQAPPSPLLNFWSLAVEEQFYIVYPAIFLVLVGLPVRLSQRARLGIGLGVIIVASYALSVAQTASDPTVAYFSPLTRAWELALGALLAVATPRLLAFPRWLGVIVSWVGLGAIAASAIAFSATTPYPGSLAAVPVVGAALVIAGGTSAPALGAESVLGTGLFQWFGKISYSLYLWHWPILILAAESAGRSSLPFRQNVWWLVVAVVAAAITYSLVENPIRHASFGGRRWAPIALGLVLILVSVGVSTVELHTHGGTPRLPHVSAKVVERDLAENVGKSDTAVEQLVGAARHITTLPSDLTPSLAFAPLDFGGPAAPCWLNYGQWRIPACLFGDPKGSHTMVVLGDSHAGEWFTSLDLVAAAAHWRLAFLGKGDCPPNDLAYPSPPGFGPAGSSFTQCDQFHRLAVSRIRALHPDLVVITEEWRTKPDGVRYTGREWTAGLERTIGELGVPPSEVTILGNQPILAQSGPQCLSQHANDVQACSSRPAGNYVPLYNAAEKTAAVALGARYVNVTPWLCSSTCTAVIGKYEVYYDDWHITETYSVYLERVLADALRLGGST
jgi:peptidoglycan/LPS O-acetylase OafA/YrhL